MGGAIGGGFTDAPMGIIAAGRHEEYFGNWTPYAEFNVFVDPEATQQVFSNAELASKTTMIPLDLTHQVLATSAVQSKLLNRGGDPPSPHPVRQLFIEILTFFAATYAKVFGMVAGPPLHDPIAVIAILEPDIFDIGMQKARFDVEVVTGAPYGVGTDLPPRLGQTVARSTSGQGVYIPRLIDLSRFWQRIDEALDLASRRSPL